MDLACAIVLRAVAIGDIAVLEHQREVLGPVACPATVWRTLDEVGGLQQRRITRARAAAGRPPDRVPVHGVADHCRGVRGLAPGRTPARGSRSLSMGQPPCSAWNAQSTRLNVPSRAHPRKRVYSVCHEP
jgi:hypothetical protein